MMKTNTTKRATKKNIEKFKYNEDTHSDNLINNTKSNRNTYHNSETSNPQNSVIKSKGIKCATIFSRFFEFYSIKLIICFNTLILINEDKLKDTIPNYYPELDDGTFLHLNVEICMVIEKFDKVQVSFFVYLLNFFNIKKVTINDYNINNKLIEIISKLDFVSILYCQFLETENFPNNFEKINNLTEFKLMCKTQQNPEDILNQLEKLQSLKVLELFGVRTHSRIDGLPKLKNLLSLKMFSIYVDSEILRDLALLTGLQKLEMIYFSEVDLYMALDKLVNLTELILVPTKHADKYGKSESHYFPNEEPDYFYLPKNCKKIKKLYLCEVLDLDIESYKNIREMTELEELTIAYTKISSPDYFHSLFEITTLIKLSLSLFEDLNINWTGLQSLVLLEEFSIKLDTFDRNVFKFIKNVKRLKVDLYKRSNLKLDSKWNILSLEEFILVNFRISREDIEIILRNQNLKILKFPKCKFDFKYLNAKIYEYNLDIDVSQLDSEYFSGN